MVAPAQIDKHPLAGLVPLAQNYVLFFGAIVDTTRRSGYSDCRPGSSPGIPPRAVAE
jgi:hypothetical protein